MRKLKQYYFRKLMNVVVRFQKQALLEKNTLLMMMKTALQESKKKQRLLKIKKFGLQN